MKWFETFSPVRMAAMVTVAIGQTEILFLGLQAHRDSAVALSLPFLWLAVKLAFEEWERPRKAE